MKLGDKIYYLRKKAGLSQEELAERVGVTRQSVSKWECGAAFPELDKLAILSSTLGVTADYLISDADPEEADASGKEAEDAGASPAQGHAYPEWVNNAPAFIGRFIKRFGWLFGVYVTAIGALFMMIGGIAKLGLSRMTSITEEFWSSVQGDMFSSPMLDDSFSSAMQQAELISGSPVAVIANVILIFGAAVVVGGIVLTVVLRRYSEK